jgi:hypothetical protein
MKPAAILIASGVLLSLTAGCTTTPPPPVPLPPPVAGCDARSLGWAIGERASAGVLERATLESGSQSARVVRPGEVVTMEFNPTRLTIEVDGRNRIVDLRCG